MSTAEPVLAPEQKLAQFKSAATAEQVRDALGTVGAQALNNAVIADYPGQFSLVFFDKRKAEQFAEQIGVAKKEVETSERKTPMELELKDYKAGFDLRTRKGWVESGVNPRTKTITPQVYVIGIDKTNTKVTPELIKAALPQANILVLDGSDKKAVDQATDAAFKKANRIG
jgi:hypothetical protein